MFQGSTLIGCGGSSSASTKQLAVFDAMYFTLMTCLDSNSAASSISPNSEDAGRRIRLNEVVLSEISSDSSPMNGGQAQKRGVR